MLKPLKLIHNESQKIYFWSDTHVFHDKSFTWEKRGYSSILDHTNGIRDKINNVCTENDILFHLGDVFLTSTLEEAENFLFSLKPKVNILWGNHESKTSKLYLKYKNFIYPRFPDEVEVYPLTYKNITFYGHYLECIINKQICILQHFPLKIWNNCKFGTWQLCGHSHGGLESSLPFANEGKILDCGVDVFSEAPVSFDKVKEIMDKKDIKSFDENH
jgi:calcineurin-like phosphoesterase family protein